MCGGVEGSCVAMSEPHTLDNPGINNHGMVFKEVRITEGNLRVVLCLGSSLAVKCVLLGENGVGAFCWCYCCIHRRYGGIVNIVQEKPQH